MTLLFSQTTLGPLKLQNHLVMSPLTRNRATGNVPNALMAEYYAQRATVGLIITEGTSPSPNGLGYPRIPGAFSPEQTAGWKLVADAVHAKGAKIFMQLMHCGRIAHPLNLPAGARMMAPSAVPAAGEIYTDAEGLKQHPTPQAMTQADLTATIAEYVTAARNAVAAGLDGVELHGANGYLLGQFIRPNSNQRTDAYGGSIENRTRLLAEVTAAVAAAIGADRVGVRLSPVSPFNDATDSQPQALFGRAVERLDEIGIAYVHVIEGETGGRRDLPFDFAALRRRFRGTWIVNNGYDRDSAAATIAAGDADLVAFGRLFIANPDLVRRLRENAPLNALDTGTLYGGDAHGYTDYPVLG